MVSVTNIGPRSIKRNYLKKLTGVSQSVGYTTGVGTEEGTTKTPIVDAMKTPLPP